MDDDHYMRKVVRAMLSHVRRADGVRGQRWHHAGLDEICNNSPDLVIVDWEMPLLNGLHFVRMVRSPGEFPLPDVPIIMLTGYGERWRVEEAARVGAHEYLLKPVSTKALHDRIVAIVSNPRPTVRLDGYYGPAPRTMASTREASDAKPDFDLLGLPEAVTR